MNYIKPLPKQYRQYVRTVLATLIANSPTMSDQNFSKIVSDVVAHINTRNINTRYSKYDVFIELGTTKNCIRIIVPQNENDVICAYLTFLRSTFLIKCDFGQNGLFGAIFRL